MIEATIEIGKTHGERIWDSCFGMIMRFIMFITINFLLVISSPNGHEDGLVLVTVVMGGFLIQTLVCILANNKYYRGYQGWFWTSNSRLPFVFMAANICILFIFPELIQNASMALCTTLVLWQASYCMLESLLTRYFDRHNVPMWYQAWVDIFVNLRWLKYHHMQVVIPKEEAPSCFNESQIKRVAQVAMGVDTQKEKVIIEPGSGDGKKIPMRYSAKAIKRMKKGKPNLFWKETNTMLRYHRLFLYQKDITFENLHGDVKKIEFDYQNKIVRFKPGILVEYEELPDNLLKKLVGPSRPKKQASSNASA